MSPTTPSPDSPQPALVAELRRLIDSARQRAAVAVNAELTLLYWQVSERIHRDILGGQRAGYGEVIVAALGRQPSAEYGLGFSVKNLRHRVRFAEAFPDVQIVSTRSGQLAWMRLVSRGQAETNREGS